MPGAQASRPAQRCSPGCRKYHKVRCDVVLPCGEEAGNAAIVSSGVALLLLQPRTSCDRLRELCKLRPRRLPPLHGKPGHVQVSESLNDMKGTLTYLQRVDDQVLVLGVLDGLLQRDTERVLGLVEGAPDRRPKTDTHRNFPHRFPTENYNTLLAAAYRGMRHKTHGYDGHQSLCA